MALLISNVFYNVMQSFFVVDRMFCTLNPNLIINKTAKYARWSKKNTLLSSKL